MIDNYFKFVVFGKIEEDVNLIMNILNEFIRKMEFFVVNIYVFVENVN